MAANPPVRTSLADVDEFAEWQAATKKPASLHLQGGEVWRGWSFGADKSVSGEVVFSTAMMGYPESLTDPSFAGQILVFTYPLLGNYGVPSPDEKDECGLPKHFEGERIYPAAVVVAEYSFSASHYLAQKTLGDWLADHGVPAIFGVDTRAITKRLRDEGSLLGALAVGANAEVPALVDPNQRNLVAEVSIKSPRVFEPQTIANGNSTPAVKSALRIVAVDCGMKYNIIRFFVQELGVHLKVVPWDYDFSEEECDGLFLSNGPGDPMKCQATINCLRRVMEKRASLPIFGICLGNQLLALAAGAKTYKLKFGNRGMNQPCIDLRTGRCFITAQNHGFAVDEKSLPQGWFPLYVNANDGSNEGIAHGERPYHSVQFHPEACGGPTDTSFLFDEFLGLITSKQGRSLTTISYQHPRSVSKVLVLGSGGLTIGQAGEFDYSGSQAIKALREQGIQSVLINPNVATVQTSKGLADQIFFLPITPEFVTQVIDKVRPDGLFAAFGGQTALNCAIALHRDGTLAKYGVRVLGTPIDAIIATEDREIFKQRVESIGERVAESACANNLEEARQVAASIGYPVLVRAAFALGGLGSGFAANQEELDELCNRAFVNSPQVIVDECLRGWKELEYEVMRDHQDNSLVVCNMENLDPMGIHTGDSIVVAPSQTLTNWEFNKLRETAIKVIRHFGIVGEANIQYALDPKSRQYRIVEVNARLSRSSALASKATGYPIAYVAAKIALGNDMATLRNLVTRSTTACFEPALDYCVVKVPRWDTDKFPTVDSRLGTQMKSVGEVMSIGRSFQEAIQKALRMVQDGSDGFDEGWYLRAKSKEDARTLDDELKYPGPLRLWAVAHAFEQGKTMAEIHDVTKIDLWFLAKLYSIHQCQRHVKQMQGLDQLKASGPALMRRCKQLGFSDRQLAKAAGCSASDVVAMRVAWGVLPVVKQVDTLAAEFPAQTNYLYMTYVGGQHDVPPLGQETLPPYKDSLYDSAFGKGHLDDEHGWSLPLKQHALDVSPKLTTSKAPEVPEETSSQKASFAVIGSGCYRIGASVEFDWGCVSAVRTLRETGHRAMVINCNPETVSTDYDESDRLYFEELTLETVREICRFEMPTGVVVSVGGQTPNNLAPKLAAEGVRILGTSAQSIDMAEDRSKFSQLCDSLGIDQPEWSQFVTLDEALTFAKSVTYPVLVRPSYVLSGAAMRVIDTEEQMRCFLETASVVEQEHPVVISKYITGAREIEFDAVGSKGALMNYAISEHVENAGTHSGDASLLLPAQGLKLETHRRVMHLASLLCKALEISGPFNVQFLAQEGRSSSIPDLKVIECNVRASRTVPFVSKTLNVNLIEIATRVMLGQEVKRSPVHVMDFNFIACKVATFSFVRLSGADPHVGVEMQSTGEVACFGRDAHEAFLKALLASGFKVPLKPCGVLLSFGPENDKMDFLPYYLPLLLEMGNTVYATPGTAQYINAHPQVARGHKVTELHKIEKDMPLKEPNVNSAMADGKIQLVITTPNSRDSKGMTAGYFFRRRVLDSGIALMFDLQQAMMLVDALHRKWSVERTSAKFWSLDSWQECHRTGRSQA